MASEKDPQGRRGRKRNLLGLEALAELVRRGDGPGGFEARRALLLLFLALEAQERGLWNAPPDDLNGVARALQGKSQGKSEDKSEGKSEPEGILGVLQEHLDTLLALAPKAVQGAKDPKSALRRFLAKGTGYRARDLFGLLKRGLEKELGKKPLSAPVPPAPSCPPPPALMPEMVLALVPPPAMAHAFFRLLSRRYRLDRRSLEQAVSALVVYGFLRDATADPYTGDPRTLFRSVGGLDVDEDSCPSSVCLNFSREKIYTLCEAKATGKCLRLNVNLPEDESLASPRLKDTWPFWYTGAAAILLQILSHPSAPGHLFPDGNGLDWDLVEEYHGEVLEALRDGRCPRLLARGGGR
jgi:hypothetical protein